MKITAQDLDQLGVIDVIISEPIGGAHRDSKSMMKATGDAIASALAEFKGKSPEEIRKQRHDRFMQIGQAL
jgi:acetyl-CoA carboxylase carboxyl transferase subunit alpha